MDGFDIVPYNDINALEDALKRDDNVAGFLVEPIQGEAGILVPDSAYLRQAKALCTARNVLFIADEIQTGLGRTGAWLGSCGVCDCQQNCEREDTYVHPDILILGKALGGGAYPVSAVLASNDVMDVLQPGAHGSTFGGNPLACKVAKAALDVIHQEKLMINARKQGQYFRDYMKKVQNKCSLIKEVRGRGLLNAIEINDTPTSKTAWNICLKLKDKHLLAKPTHGNIIRLAPPLVITSDEMTRACAIIEDVLINF